MNDVLTTEQIALMQKTVAMGYGLTLGCAEAQQILDMLVALTPRWTTDKPSRHGWYWYRTDEPRIVKVSKGFSSMVAELSTLNSVYTDVVDDLDGEWAGPLSPPTPLEVPR